MHWGECPSAICSSSCKRFHSLHAVLHIPLAYQKTRLQRFYEALGQQLLSPLATPWRCKAVAILALSGGFFCGQNISAVANALLPLNSIGALWVMLVYELLVRMRTLAGLAGRFRLARQAVDNFRIGLVFAFVLEAFKLGS